jgi:trimeric autotransporter adhesin
LEEEIAQLKNAVRFNSNMLGNINDLSNYPNPFNQETNISFHLSESTQKAFIIIYDSMGKEIKRIKISERGNSEIVLDASQFLPGTYTYSLVADSKIINSSKMVIR